MNYFTANQILDKAKDGKHYPDHIINQALELTGDFNESYVAVRGKGVDFTAQTQDEGSGGKRSPWVVAQGVIRHSADSWSVGV
jgi:hypothetical protein|tara:strand:+ start:1455 stop:1703 length:249 start_codon:yes stop_codon:yes gene_type:complete